MQNKNGGMTNVLMRHVTHVHTAVVCRDGWRGHVTRHVTRMNTPCQSCAWVMSRREGRRGEGSCSGVCMAPYHTTQMCVCVCVCVYAQIIYIHICVYTYRLSPWVLRGLWRCMTYACDEYIHMRYMCVCVCTHVCVYTRIEWACVSPADSWGVFQLCVLYIYMREVCVCVYVYLYMCVYIEAESARLMRTLKMHFLYECYFCTCVSVIFVSVTYVSVIFVHMWVLYMYICECHICTCAMFVFVYMYKCTCIYIYIYIYI